MRKYPFDLRSFNPYDPHCIVKDHYARVQFNWIHGASHWAEEDSWRYCYNSSKPNEQFGFTIEWLAQQHEVASWRAPALVATTEIAKPSIHVRDKGKRKIVDHIEEEQSCKFRACPLVEQVAMAIQAKR